MKHSMGMLLVRSHVDKGLGLMICQSAPTHEDIHRPFASLMNANPRITVLDISDHAIGTTGFVSSPVQ
jgi:hypothetical protein